VLPVLVDPVRRARGGTPTSAALQFFFAAMMTAYLLFLPRELDLSGTVVGLALAAVGPGALVGSLLAARLPRRFGCGAVLTVAAVVGDGAFLCVPALPRRKRHPRASGPGRKFAQGLGGPAPRWTHRQAARIRPV
jgi:predicted MFS family arabinose efflux permease